jgi:5-oxoprolinase (ATP-hydrolysing)
VTSEASAQLGSRKFRIGFDIGGTFTDFVLYDETTGDIRLNKCLTTPHDPAVGAMQGIGALLAAANLSLADIYEVVHGTTLVANAIIERKGARTALLMTHGFRDVLEAGFEQRYDVHDLFLRFPEPLVPRRRRYEIDERMSRDGVVLQPLDHACVEDIAALLRADGIEAVAVCLLHSYRNPSHEREVGRMLQRLCPGVAISLSSDVVAELREYERACTTTANAFVQPLMRDYLQRLESALQQEGFTGRLSLMLSSGGLTSPETARRLPIRLLESGPAGGGLATGLVGRAANRPDLIGFDMGGTTAKATLLENYATQIAPMMEAARIERFKRGSGIPIKAPVIDMIEIGAGGGSIASIDELGLLKVGPRSAGADPGPVCYGRNGMEPTVTDANLILGYLDGASFLGGEMPLDRDAAERALTRLGSRLNLDAAATAWGIYKIVCENMAGAARVHIVERGRDPRRYTMVAIGGAGPAHAAHVARLIGVAEVIVPRASGAASALGFLAAPPSFEMVRSSVMPIGDTTDFAQLAAILAELEAEASEHVRAHGVAAADIVVERGVDMRLAGQFREITVPLPDGPFTPASVGGLLAEFRRIYEQLYNVALPGPVEAISWRVRARGPAPAIALRAAGGGAAPQAMKGRRPVFFGAELCEATVYNRYALQPGAQIYGPAVIEERESTTIVPPGDTAEVDAALNLVIRLHAAKPMAKREARDMQGDDAVRRLESDPIGLEIIWSRLINITEQCWSNVCRTAFSLIIGVAQDFSVEILDRNGNTVASNPRGQPAFDLCMPVTAQALLARFPIDTLAPGDVLTTNDPWLVAGHLDDVAIITPIFHDGVVVGHIGAIGHVSDIGGVRRYPGVTELYEEGLQIPTLMLFRAGRRNEDLFAMIRENVRDHEKVIGDLMALVGASAMGAEAVVGLLDEYGLSDLVALGRIVQGRSENAMRRAIQAIPNGVFESVLGVEIGGAPMKLPVQVEILDDQIVVDFAGIPPQLARGGFNSTFNYSAARAKNPIKCLLTPEVRANEGCFRPIHVKIPERSILNCAKPSAVRDRVVTGWNVTPLVLAALAEAMPQRAQAFSGYPASIKFYGEDEAGMPFSDYLMAGGGQGASAGRDGKSGLIFPTSSANTSVELAEVRVPVVVVEKAFVTDSAGAGTYRGGLAQRVKLRKLHDDQRPLRVGVVPSGLGIEVASMFGGEPGEAVGGRLLDGALVQSAALDGDSLVLSTASEEVEVTLAAGHGYGHPRGRAPSAIERDIEEGYLTLAAAISDYGYSPATPAASAEGFATQAAEAAR